MGSTNHEKPHVVCIPYPAQGHINPMLKLAKLLHSKGFHVTFVNTEYNRRRLLRSRGPHSLDGLPSFRFQAIPDGLPESDADATQDIPALCASTRETCLAPFLDLIAGLNDSSPDVPPVTCIVSDGVMSFTLDAAEKLGIPEVLFWTTSACGFLAYLNYRNLIDKKIIPLGIYIYSASFSFLDIYMFHYILRSYPSKYVRFYFHHPLVNESTAL